MMAPRSGNRPKNPPSVKKKRNPPMKAEAARAQMLGAASLGPFRMGGVSDWEEGEKVWV